MFPWHHMIDEATSLDMLLVLARDYLACWGDDDLDLIPERARPTTIESTDDIAFWHQRLVDSYCNGVAQSRACERVRNMLHFFACALQKASELRGIPAIGDSEGVAWLFSENTVPKHFRAAAVANDR